jgi:hypothetical protein
MFLLSILGSNLFSITLKYLSDTKNKKKILILLVNIIFLFFNLNLRPFLSSKTKFFGCQFTLTT